MITSEELNEGLHQFIGTNQYHILNPFTDIVATDGVKYLCDKAEAYWLFTDIAINYERLEQPFLVAKLNVKDNSAEIRYEDGNGNELYKMNYSYTDFPEGEYTLYALNKTILLPQEY